jgi:hypothetical protein
VASSKKSRPTRRRSERAAGEKQEHTLAGTPLEEFLVACQKSLARSVRSAQQSGKADNEFALGERPVYMIQALEMEVSAGLNVNGPTEGRNADRVLIDFDAPGELRSKVRFRVESRPVELLRGAKLELANLDPLGHSSPIARLRAWLVDDKGTPVAAHGIVLHFARAGEKRDKYPIAAMTDSAGRVDFFVDPPKNEVKVVGLRKPFRVFLRGGGRGVNVDEYFLWATATPRPEWLLIAEPSAPRPPQPIERDAQGHPLQLCSEMHRLRIE